MLRNALWLFLLATCAFFIFLPSYSRMQDLKKRNLEYKQQIVILNKEQAELEEERRLLAEDPTYLEKVAREKMGLIKENEVIFKIIPANSVTRNP